MSYEIEYDRRFIKLPADGKDRPETLYMPIWQIGSNNAYEVLPNGREVPEKTWCCINDYWKPGIGEHVKKLFFTENEMKDLAKSWAEDTSDLFMSRNRQWKSDELEAWLLAGMKTAMTLEEYKERNVRVRADLNVWDSKNNYHHRMRHIETTDELVRAESDMRALQKAENLPEGGFVNIGFDGRDCMKNLSVYRRKETARKFLDSDKFYVISRDDNSGRDETFLVSCTGRGTVLCGNVLSAKKFETEQKAERFLDRTDDPWIQRNFSVKEISRKNLNLER